MATYDHLPLKRVEGALERRKQPFGETPSRDATSHGAKVESAIKAALDSHAVLSKQQGIDPSLILKVKSSTFIAEDEWRRLGMVLLSSEGDNSVVLFANDKSLSEFRRKVGEYQQELPLGQKNPRYAALVAAIDDVSLLGPVDRIGPVIKRQGFWKTTDFSATQDYLLDVELHYPPRNEDADLFLYRLENVIKGENGRVLSTYRGSQILMAGIGANGTAVTKALALPEVAKIDLPPTPDFLQEDYTGVTLSDVVPGDPAPDDAVTIGIIDTGVNFGHPLLDGLEAGAITFDPSGDAADGKGHGTQVASIAAYGDISLRIEKNDFSQQFKIASARVLDSEGRFLKGRLLPDLMSQAIRRLHKEHGCRIFNVSLGDDRRPYLGGKIDTWSASLDHLSRELDVVIIVSAGNRRDLTASFADGILAQYPHYLATPGSRVIEPATAAMVLTVGAIAHSNGIEEDDEDLVGVQSICQAQEPSPFTRSGPGVLGMTKPELVDLGGTAVWDGPSGKIVTGAEKPTAGVLAFSHKPIEQLIVSRSGTSLAAPAVANKAARLLEVFPNASANLIRSLLGLSASVPRPHRPRTNGLSPTQMTGVCGHGVANIQHAASSDDSRVVFFAEDHTELDHFVIFEVPIPEIFQKTKGAREIRVSLAFDPPTRHTRADYLGVTMGWRLLRGASLNEVKDRFRKWDKEEGSPPDFPKRFVCPTTPGSQSREHGTLQVGTYTGSTNISAYGERYFVAVWSLRRWAPADVQNQRFALAVQLRHQNVNDLYNVLKQPVKVRS